MEGVQWFAWFALMILIFYSAYLKKLKKLKIRVKKLERKQKGAEGMSKIINELIGKKCKIDIEDRCMDSECIVLDTDDEWIKITCTDEDNKTKVEILRIDSIEKVEVIDE